MFAGLRFNSSENTQIILDFLNSFINESFCQDCLPQEEYRSIHPKGESESPYVFICSSPQELPVKFPIKGAHKIC